MPFCFGRDKAYMWEIFSRNNGVALRFSKEYFKLSTIPILSLNNGQVDPILARTRISYEDGKQKEDDLTKLAALINKLLGELTKENQAEILVRLYQSIIALSPKFLTSETNLHFEQEYRCYAF